MSEVEDMIKALDAGMTKVADVNRELREENEQLREDLRLAVMSDTEYCKAIEDDNKRLREALERISDDDNWCGQIARAALKEKK